MTMTAIEERFSKAWREGTDALLTRLGAAAAGIVLGERPEDDDRAEAAARRHLRQHPKVRVHFKDDLKLWVNDHGPARAVEQARKEQQQRD